MVCVARCGDNVFSPCLQLPLVPAADLPTSPSRTVADHVAGATGPSQTAARPETGTAGTVFVEVQPGVFGFAAGVDNGVTGREVQLTGDIVVTS